MTLRPLTDVLPCIGAVTVTLMETPYLDFSLHLMDSFDLMQIPGVKQGIAYGMNRVRSPKCNMTFASSSRALPSAWTGWIVCWRVSAELFLHILDSSHLMQTFDVKSGI